jgi:hypothetical protein
MLGEALTPDEVGEEAVVALRLRRPTQFNPIAP